MRGNMFMSLALSEKNMLHTTQPQQHAFNIKHVCSQRRYSSGTVTSVTAFQLTTYEVVKWPGKGDNQLAWMWFTGGSEIMTGGEGISYGKPFKSSLFVSSTQILMKIT